MESKAWKINDQTCKEKNGSIISQGDDQSNSSLTLEYTNAKIVIGSLASSNIFIHVQKQNNFLASVGVEPTTLGLLDPRSNQLSYEADDMTRLY